MTISATIPVEHMGDANFELRDLGFGPENFSVPVRSGADAATHAGLHCWDNPAFLTALQGLTYPGLTIRVDEGGTVNFPDHCSDQALEWSDPTDWFQNPVMIGDQREHGGKTWESLVDNNVWEPPVAWREVVEEGYPEWVQPTGAHDAYPLDFIVTHNGSDWQSNHSANVWEPGATGITTWDELVSSDPDAWQAGIQVTVGEQYTYQGSTYEVIQSHTTQVGWEPPNVPALWQQVA